MHNIKKLKSPAMRLLALTLLTALLLPLGISASAASKTASQGAVYERELEPSRLVPVDESGALRLERSEKRTLDEDFSSIRVLITVGNVSSIRLKLVGAYYIDQNNCPIIGTEASPAVVTLRAASGKVSLVLNEETLYTGETLDLNRVLVGVAGGNAELETSGDEGNNGRKYLGSFRVSANTNGSIRLVNHIATAHYLYGIVPYERSESCHIEALKTQAVAAKSYAFGFTIPGPDYDITDSYSYQGYRGYRPGFPKCMRACLETIGDILSYNGTVPLCFYAATNGGETTLPSYVFGASPLDGAYDIRLDDLDMEYGSSKVQELDIMYNTEVTNAAFKRLLEARAKESLGRSVTLVSVQRAELNTPAFADTTHDMTRMDVDMTVRDGGSQRSVSVRFAASLLKSYGVFNKNYKIYWGKTISGGYKVYFCRWGHGIGLSQYGSDGFAALGHGYRDILAFYYSRMQLETVRERNPEAPSLYTKPIVAYGRALSTVELRSAPSASSASLASLGENAHVAIVTEEDGWLVVIADNKLGFIPAEAVDVTVFASPAGAQQPIVRAVVAQGANAKLMSEPSEHSALLATLAEGVSLQVWHTIGSWSHVRVGSRFGFVKTSQLVLGAADTIDLYTTRKRVPSSRP